MLPFDVARCAGFIGDDTHTRCDRRFQCARFLSRAGANTPFHLSACGDGVDRFIHADSMPADPAGAHPYPASSDGVLSASPAAQGER